MRYVRSARMWWVGLVVVVGLGVAQAQPQPPTPRASLTSIEQKVDGLQMTVDGSALPRYQDNGDGTITDRQTGLMWLKLDDANVGGAARSGYCAELEQCHRHVVGRGQQPQHNQRD